MHSLCLFAVLARAIALTAKHPKVQTVDLLNLFPSLTPEYLVPDPNRGRAPLPEQISADSGPSILQY